MINMAAWQSRQGGAFNQRTATDPARRSVMCKLLLVLPENPSVRQGRQHPLAGSWGRLVRAIAINANDSLEASHQVAHVLTGFHCRQFKRVAQHGAMAILLQEAATGRFLDVSQPKARQLGRVTALGRSRMMDSGCHCNNE